MKLQIMSVYDIKAELWGRPMFMQTVGICIRSFTDEVNREAENNDYWKHPGDYDLYHIGEYDDETGAINAVPKRLLIRGEEAKAINERKDRRNTASDRTAN